MLRNLIFIVTLLIFKLSFSQNEDSYVFGDNGGKTSSSSEWKVTDPFDWQRVTVGGGLGLTFGTVTLIEIAPTFGYYLTQSLLAGIGGNYTYFSDDRFNFNTSIYGGNVFAEYFIQGTPITLHVEPEFINFESTVQQTRINVFNFLVGGGIRQKIGGNSYVSILFLYNLNETRESRTLSTNQPHYKRWNINRTLVFFFFET